ncbi:MAG: alpha/beta hydrolase [Acidimicrobiia bacterium]
MGLDYQDVSYESPLGDMAAWKIGSGEGTVWAVHVHGWRASRREALRSLPTYARAGITSLVIDYRNDPDEPADPSGIYRFGRSEWADVEGAVQYAIDHGAQQLVLVGYSTGAALDLAFLQNSPLADRVSAVVFDSPNVDMGETVRFAATKRTLPGTSIAVPASLTAVAMWLSDLRWDVSWSEIDYVDRAAQTIQVPTLVFHGLDDDRVPVEVSRRLATQAPGWVRLVEVEGAGHVTSWNVDPGRYEQTLLDFLEQSH